MIFSREESRHRPESINPRMFKTWIQTSKFQCGVAALLTILSTIVVWNTNAWAKKATDTQRFQKAQKSKSALSSLANLVIPETPTSYVPPGTLNKQIQNEFAAGSEMQQFKQQYGPHWQVLVDERSMVPMMLMGEGIPLTTRSAKASQLPPKAQISLAREETMEALEKAAFQFLRDNQAILKVDPNSLQFDPDASGVLEESTGKYRLVFARYSNGVPVLDSSVSLFISHGNIILYGADHMAPIGMSPVPALSRSDALLSLARSLEISESDLLLEHAAELLFNFVESPVAAVSRARSGRDETFPTPTYDGPAGQGYAPKLVYRIQFHIPNDQRSLLALVDANTGHIIDLYDQNRYQSQTGKVLGAIYTRGPVSSPGYVNQGGTQCSEYTVPFPLLNVSNGGTTVNTNPGGAYPFGGLSPSGFSTTFNGFQANVMEIGNLCTPPVGPADASGSIMFQPGFDDGVCSVNNGTPSPGNGLSTHGARNGWFHTNFAVTHSQKFLMNYNTSMTNFYNTSMNVLVNDSGCQAFWAVGQCDANVTECIDMGVCGTSAGENNQADEPDTMSHEYGHALDYHTKGGLSTGDRGKGEGLADIDAWLNTHRTCLSAGDSFPPLVPPQSFRGFPLGDSCNVSSIPQEPANLQGTGVRDYGVFICNDDGSGACGAGTTGRLQSNDQDNACGSPGGSCRGSLGYECHCEGHTSSGSVIDLFKLLVNRYGTNQAWYMIEWLYYLGLPGITQAYGSSGSSSTYSNFLAVDDDNGNIADGTPNADLIFQAFRAHGTEGTQVPQFRVNCSTSPGSGSPAAPSSFTASAQSTGGILLQWSPVSGATGYYLYRTEASSPGHNYETDPLPSSYYGRNGVFFPLINPSTRGPNPNSGTNLFPANGTGTQSYLDEEVAPGFEYFYQIQAVMPSGGFSCLSSLSPNGTDLVANATAPTPGPLTLAVSANKGASEVSLGQGSLVQGYGQISTTTPTQPAALANFGFVQNGILTTEAGVAAATTTTSARLFVDYSTAQGTDSGVAVVNPTSSTIVVNLVVNDAAGNSTACPSRNVPAMGHFAFFASQLCPSLPNPFLGTLTITSSTAFSAASLQLATNSHGEQLYNSLPVAVPNSPPTGLTLNFSQFADGGGFSTEILLMNLTGSTISGTVAFFDDNHNPVTMNFSGLGSVSQINYNIPGNGMAKFFTTGNTSPNLQFGSVVVTKTSGALPSGAVIFSRYNAAGGLTSQAGVLNSPLTTSARMYIEKSSSPLMRDTGVALVNPNPTSVQVQLSLSSLDGSFNANNTLNLAANAHIKGFIDEAAVMGAAASTIPANFQGVLTLSSTVSIAPLTLRLTRNQRSEDLYSTLPAADLNNPPSAPQYLPQIADGSQGTGFFTTQIILVNTSSSSGTITINLFGDAGSQININFQ